MKRKEGETKISNQSVIICNFCKEKRRKDMKLNRVLVLIFFCCMISSGCGSDISENKVVYENKKESIVFDNTNVVGNSFSNLGYQCVSGSVGTETGRVTSQGNVVCFFEKGVIYGLSPNGKKISICAADNASSLNIIGNTIYYLEDSMIYGVNINSGEKEEILTMVSGPFFVYNDVIYYVQSSNASATTYEYHICKYFIGENREERINVGEKMPILVGLEPQNENRVIFYYEMDAYQHPSYTALWYGRHNLVCADFDGNVYFNKEYIAPFYGVDNVEFYALLTESYLYATQYCEEDGIGGQYIFSVDSLDNSQYLSANELEVYGYIEPRNSYKDDLIIYGNIQEKFGLYLLENEDINGQSIIADNLNVQLIVSENTSIREVYVVDDYIYYTIDDYENANLYRIKIDGTGWEEL